MKPFASSDARLQARRRPVRGATAMLCVLGAMLLGHASPAMPSRNAAAGPAVPAADDDARVRSAATAPPVVAPSHPTAEATIARNQCVTINVGVGAYECGGLRLGYALPATTTMNRARGPMLTWNSDHSVALPIVAAWVTVPAGAVVPDSVYAALYVGTGTTGLPFRSGGTWSGQDWGTPGATAASAIQRRVALDFAAASLPTGVYDYRLLVRFWRGGVMTASAITGELTIVNRIASPFGRGWWLAGLDALYPAADHVLWVGGDGSARKYAKVTDAVWVADAVTRPDTLKKTSTGYVRPLPGGARVEYDLAGRHTATVSRTGQRTTFHYRAPGSRILTAVELPVHSGPRPRYTFAYTPDSLLASITAPAAGTQARVTTFEWTPGASTSELAVTGAAGRVRYVYGGTGGGLVLTFYDAAGTRTGFVWTRGTLSSARLYMNGVTTSSADLVTTFTPAERRGMAPKRITGSTALASAPTVVDGPRSDRPDDLTIGVGRFGAPDWIKDPLQKTTAIYRQDARFPGLVTRVVPARGVEMRASYDERGRVRTTTALNPFGNGANNVTRYEYDSIWPDFVTRIVGALGDSTVMDYDPATGNRLWQQPGADATRRAYFGYNTSGQVIWTQTPLQRSAGVADTVWYDAMGNPWGTRSAGGVRVIRRFDAIGRDTAVITPTGTATVDWNTLLATGARQSIAYDAAGRVRETRTTAPGVSFSALDERDPVRRVLITLPQDTLVVTNEYDAAGRLRAVSRRSGLDATRIGTVTTRWEYDRAGRKVAEIAPDGKVDSLFYDPAGNVTATRGRTGHRITMEYDALNRLVKRTVPQLYVPGESLVVSSSAPAPYRTWYFPLFGPGPEGELTARNTSNGLGAHWLRLPEEVTTYEYDDAGHLVRADNRDALVRRSYYPNGLVRTETQKILTYLGRDSTSNVYQLAYEYDRYGRRTHMTLPPNLTLDAAWMRSLKYDYDPLTGALTRVYSPEQPGYAFTFAYNRDGQIETQVRNGTVTERWKYDLDGRRIWQQRARGSYVMHEDSFTFDPRGLVARVRSRADSVRNAYTGLGALAWSYQDRFAQDSDPEEVLLTDALANVYESRSTHVPLKAIHPTTTRALRYYAPGTGRSDSTKHYLSEELLQTTGTTMGSGDEVSSITAKYLPLDHQEVGGDGLLIGLSPLRSIGEFQHRALNAFDAAGNQLWFEDQKSVAYPGLLSPGTGDAARADLVERTRKYYGPDGRLRVVDRRTCAYGFYQSATSAKFLIFNVGLPTYVYTCGPPHYPDVPTFEEYRYDALGRRVLTRTDQSWACGLGCVNGVTRTIWDGSQIVAEIRAPDHARNEDVGRSDPMDQPMYGRVLYTHAHGIDAPLALTRLDYDSLFPAPEVILPHSNWQGNYDSGTFSSTGGERGPCRRVSIAPPQDHEEFEDPWGNAGGGDQKYKWSDGSDSLTVCMTVPWPAKAMWAYMGLRNDEYRRHDSWMGSLILGMRDPSGQMYMRNRYYDPQSGRFTQEDPIGIAGGLNVYGFAEGDPVNFSDPFGLCKKWLSSRDDGKGSCDYDGDGTESATEIAAHKSVTADSWGARVAWHAIGLFNAAVEDQRGAALIGVLSAGRTAAGRPTDRFGNPLGPSGRPMVNKVKHSTRKAAKDAARHEGDGAPENHPSPTKGRQHFHPTKKGEKAPNSTHHEYP